nr:MAG TPA: hypothetical protein [Bacteriophage sp.]
MFLVNPKTFLSLQCPNLSAWRVTAEHNFCVGIFYAHT